MANIKTDVQATKGNLAILKENAESLVKVMLVIKDNAEKLKNENDSNAFSTQIFSDMEATFYQVQSALTTITEYTQDMQKECDNLDKLDNGSLADLD